MSAASDLRSVEVALDRDRNSGRGVRRSVGAGPAGVGRSAGSDLRERFAHPRIPRSSRNRYVITDRISNFLTWGRLRALEARGVEIGSHTATHADLTTLTDERALDELVRSRRALEAKLGHPVPWLAYPFGAHDARVVQLARRAGYAVAVTTVHGVRHDASRPLELRRLRVLDSTGVAGLAALLSRANA